MKKLLTYDNDIQICCNKEEWIICDFLTRKWACLHTISSKCFSGLNFLLIYVTMYYKWIENISIFSYLRESHTSETPAMTPRNFLKKEN